MNGKYKNLTPEQNKIIQEYCDDNLKELKKVCYFVWGKKGVIIADYDDLYSDAMNVLLESVVSYNGERGAGFKTYLTNNIRKSFSEWYRNQYLRLKRNNLELDENGKIKLDEHGRPIRIENVSFDAQLEDGSDLKEKIADTFSIEEESDLDFEGEENVNEFLDSLSRLQRNIVTMRMENIPIGEVKKKLGLTDNQYFKEMCSIKMNKNMSKFARNINDGNYTEVKNMEDRIIEICESEDYRTDKYNLFTLLQDKKSGDMNCNYILQREPHQWTEEDVNRYICRILSNLPIPEIIICEQEKRGLKISYLIDGLQRLTYAEDFKENRIKISEKGAERHLIQYREFKIDENGNRVLDEEGLPVYELKVCDVIGKRYDDLPDFLKKRFNNFNINVTKFFRCTDEQISDHTRDYNSHVSMNKEQSGLTKISVTTARYIKQISQDNSFFKNCKKFTDNSKIKGKPERVVAEAIMLMFFCNAWKSDLDTIYKYIDENATEQQFSKLDLNLSRLDLALGNDNDDVRALFTPTTMPMWATVFDKFTTYNLDDSNFVDFLKAYNNGLKDKDIDGISMKNFKDQQTKKKATITGKIDLLIKLMNEFLHINATEKAATVTENNVVDEKIESHSDNSLLKFVKENADPDATDEDVELFSDMAEDCFTNNGIRCDSPVYQKCKAALTALLGYACRKDQDREVEEWFSQYKDEIHHGLYKKSNYTCMKNSFDNFVNKGAIA